MFTPPPADDPLMLSESFWVFAEEEVQCWADEYGDTHEPQPMEYLVEPTGRIEAPLMFLAHWPTFTTT
ncbi:hypothetical protein GJ744_009942 [Endocarpon pusillum]|uniref:Uncharacterized protein n=1 Tax=Endocarpon pusillum TaxID=364733 RepID=A0A8H7AFC0_9EURO|nr:hypothetical protein GJ744_009942 [Endocarpon pusillum]